MQNPYKNQIRTFENATLVARQITYKYQRARDNPTTRQRAIYCIIGDVYLFTIAMQHEGKIERIHTSCASRLPNTILQNRSAFAVVLLLLRLVDPQSFNRYKRYRVSKALCAAQKAGVDHSQLIPWINAHGGLEGLKRGG